jgi:hypothetical protein
MCTETRKGLSGWTTCEEHRDWKPAPSVTRTHTDAEILAALTTAAEGTGTYLDDYTFDGDIEVIVKAFHALTKDRT